MRFYFDIDESEFVDEYSAGFKEVITNGVIREVAQQVYDVSTDADRWYSEISKQINELVKSKQNEICDMVAERVAEKVAKKKAIVAITPKASEIAAADKDNVAYFEQMIDKAIAKRFGK
jgi:deoxyxylulose-5-phosphate synthase